jgi:predicted site-specific integrase-resolvase
MTMSELLVPSKDDPWLKPSDVAKMFSVTVRTVRIWCSENKIRSITLPNGHIRIPHSAMVEYANKLYGEK